ncbi:MAG: selenocysteine-specific translation elongation factor [Planctomycetes bacterium]|jgi:selenocysteine-specific elongation factor|nr:selenocysteine-specific translation elongation factor [Planctomycetota bacterium]
MSDARKNIMLGTAGHVDHGKTALVTLLTGCDTDRLREEKQRGLTIELGFAPCTMADERIVGVVDVPGHVGFIKNMVAGAHGIDVVILIVAADDGVMPQTREHLDILTLMGCRRGVVALTKIDLIDEALREMAVREAREFLSGTFLAGAPICPVSSITGEGFGEFSTALNAAVAATEPLAGEGLFRLWVERVFNIKGFGTVVSGIPRSGEVRVGQRLRLLPCERAVRVRSMQVYGQDAEVGRAGECVALNLLDVEAGQIDRGMVLTGAECFRAVEMFEAALALLPSAPSLKDNAEVHLHVGTAESMARVANLAGEKAVASGGEALVQIRMISSVPVAIGERFVIRGTGTQGRLTTLGGGRILGVSDTKLRRKRPWTLEQLAARRDAIDDPFAWVLEVLGEADAALSSDELARRCQMPVDMVSDLLDDAVAEGQAVAACGGKFVHVDRQAATAETLVAALQAFHAAHPRRNGAPIGILLSDSGAGLRAAAVEKCLADGRVKQRDNLLALVGYGAQLSDADRTLAGEIESTLAEAGLEPPRPDELAEQLGAAHDRLEAMLQLLCDEGRVVRLDEKVAMAPGALDRARQVVLDLFTQGSGFETVAFRDALGVSRKYAVPLLDYFDTQNLTVRTGNRRTPGVEARRLLGEGA